MPHRPTFRPSNSTFVFIPTSCKIEACTSITHHGVIIGANLSRPLSSAETYDPFPLTRSLSLLPVFPFLHLSCLLDCHHLAWRFGKRDLPVHLRIFTVKGIMHFGHFSFFFCSTTPYKRLVHSFLDGFCIIWVAEHKHSTL